jgi:hypothetical protein
MYKQQNFISQSLEAWKLKIRPQEIQCVKRTWFLLLMY